MASNFFQGFQDRRSPRRSRAVLGFMIVTLVGWIHPVSAAWEDDPIFPAAHWVERDPAELGCSPAALDRLAEELGGRGCVIRDGYIVKQWGDQEEKGDWYSAVKPVFSTLLFFAIEEERVRDIDAPIREFGWDLKGKDREITFRHLANMTSGYARPEPPGAAWAYNDHAIQLYQMTLFDRVFQADPTSVLLSDTHLGPLGFEDSPHFSSRRRLRASVRDFGRIAWFWANEGRWAGSQLLPAAYFREHMRPDVPPDLPHTREAETNDVLGIGSFGGGSDHFTRYGPGIYGFNWWFNGTSRLNPERPTWPDAPADAVMSLGFGGNVAWVFPSWRMVVVSAKGDWGSLEAGNPQSTMNLRMRRIREAMRMDVPGG